MARRKSANDMPVMHDGAEDSAPKANAPEQEKAVVRRRRRENKRRKPLLSEAERQLVSGFLRARIEEAIRGAQKAAEMQEIDPSLPGIEGQKAYFNHAIRFGLWCLTTTTWGQDWMIDAFPDRYEVRS